MEGIKPKDPLDGRQSTNKQYLPAMFKEGITKIEYYCLGEEVREMRRKGYSYMRIAKELQTTYKDKLYGDTISVITVSRWCRDNCVEDYDPEKSDETINAYRENLKMMKMVDDNIELIKIYLDAVSEMVRNGADNKTILGLFKNSKELQVQLEHYIARKQDIVQHIFMMQKEVYSMQTLNDVLRLVLDTVKDKDKKMYDIVVTELKKNPKFLEATKKIGGGYAK